MKKNDFFDKYKESCKRFNNGPIHIPKIDLKNGIPGNDIILMFINERPGRIGPGKSDLVSFENQDPTARRFKRLFNILNIDRKKIFITNACIYYPLETSYTDTPPTQKEINFSAPILDDQINRINPKIIIPLGNTALRTLKLIIPELKKTKLQTSVAKPIKGRGISIFPLYHTSNRAAITHNEEKQIKDWQELESFIVKLSS